MPVEAVGKGSLIELTDRTDVINTAIDNAKTEERSWPSVQYLWDGHPILEWFSDHAGIFFPENSAPLCKLQGHLKKGEVVVLLHGAIPNEIGAPIVDSWRVVYANHGCVSKLETIGKFLNQTRLSDNTPNSGEPNASLAASALNPAVDAFQSYLVGVRNKREVEIEAGLSVALDRLSAFEGIYARRASMSACGINIRGRSRKLGLNYRTSDEIRTWAVSKCSRIIAVRLSKYYWFNCGLNLSGIYVF